MKPMVSPVMTAIVWIVAAWFASTLPPFRPVYWNHDHEFLDDSNKFLDDMETALSSSELIAVGYAHDGRVRPVALFRDGEDLAVATGRELRWRANVSAEIKLNFRSSAT